jgi:hypothetical protein
VKAWDSEHLTTAATQWANTATVWEDAFTHISTQMPCPGGLPWEGEAAEAAQQRAYADRLTVIGVADQLHEASSIARGGASEVQAAKRSALAAISAAQNAGFVVEEDFSVTDRQRVSAAMMAARQAQAQSLAADIRTRVAELITTDQQVAAKITAVAADVDTVRFPESDDAEGKPTIRAVDYHTVKEAPPQPPPPDPPPGPMPPINNADDVTRVLDPLPNGGKRGPNGVGTNPEVKEVWDEGSMRQLWDYLTRNGTDTQGPPTFKGPVRRLPDGTEIGWRQSGKGWGDTIDVWYPDGTDKKIHTPYKPYFPSIGVPPELPPPGHPAPLPLPPPQTSHAPVALPPTGIFDPNGLPPWLQNPSTPGFYTPVQPPTIMPGVAVPDVPAPAPVSPGPALLPELGHDLAEAGKTGGAIVLGGIAIIGGLISGGVTPSGQIAR